MRVTVREASNKPITLKPGDLVYHYLSEPDEKGQKKIKKRTLKVLNVYPYMIRCIDFDGHKEGFSRGDYYCGLLEKVNIE